MADDEYISVTTMAARLGISRSLAYRLVERNEVPNIRFGESIRIPVKEFNEWLAKKKKMASAS